jgi:hypothetical protein
MNGCHSEKLGPQPRGRTTTSLMQSGWRLIQRGEVMTREPVMVPITTEWKPMKCGVREQAGLGPDPWCEGCLNLGGEE